MTTFIKFTVEVKISYTLGVHTVNKMEALDIVAIDLSSMLLQLTRIKPAVTYSRTLKTSMVEIDITTDMSDVLLTEDVALNYLPSNVTIRLLTDNHNVISIPIDTKETILETVREEFKTDNQTNVGKLTLSNLRHQNVSYKFYADNNFASLVELLDSPTVAALLAVKLN